MSDTAKRHNQKPNLRLEERNAILHFLLQCRNFNANSGLHRGAIADAASKFGVNRKTISNIWIRAKSTLENGGICMNVASKISTNSGRKSSDLAQKLEKIGDVPLNRRTTIRGLSSAINIPKTTLHRALKSRLLRRHSNAIKPLLTIENMRTRVEFALSHIRDNGLFIDMYDHVHIDEKWFYLTKTNTTYYLGLDEPDPIRTCKSKRYITKVMFLAAVARPRYDYGKKVWFNGLIGIWPYVYEEPAKRHSKNRPAGTMVTKVIETIDAAQHRRMMLEHVLPAIMNSWPNQRKDTPIYVQQDNAKPHSYTLDKELQNAALICNWDIRIKRQPSNSPDFNVLDLGFFNSIQSIQHQKAPTNIKELILVVKQAFKEEKRDTLDNVFLSLQQCMIESLKVNGNNTYKLAHMGKDKLRRQGLLPVSLLCEENVLSEAKKRLL